MMPIQCPDCDTHLHGADRCKCGWVMARVSKTFTPGVERRCLTVGCPTVALVYSKFCDNCETRVRQEGSAARCAELGLVTIEDKRAYCARLARSFGRGPSFETWAKTITQRTVDLIDIQGGKDRDLCFERLRAVGAIDGRNKLIPLDGREVAADAYRQERARELVRVQTELAERALKEQQQREREPAP